MSNIEIRKVTTNDLDQLQKIGRQTFYETFASGNTEDNMNKYLDEAFSVAKLATELSDNNADFYFVTLDNNVIGYLKINFGQSQTELKDEKAVEIERIYVLKEFHGKKLDNYFSTKQLKSQDRKTLTMFGLVYGKKIRER